MAEVCSISTCSEPAVHIVAEYDMRRQVDEHKPRCERHTLSFHHIVRSAEDGTDQEAGR